MQISYVQGTKKKHENKYSLLISYYVSKNEYLTDLCLRETKYF